MRISKYLAVMALGLCTVLVSCNQDNEGAIYTTSFQNVSFEQEEANTVTTSEESITIPVRLTRSIASGEYTTTFSIESEDEGVFSTEGNNVTFANGQGVTYINLKAENLEKGKDYACTINLSEQDIAQADTITKTQVTETVIKIHADYNWVAAGKCTFVDLNFSEEGKVGKNVVIENGEGSNVYRIVDPYVAAYGSQPGNITFTMDEDGEIELTNGRHFTAWGYTIYSDNENYAAYCYTEKDGNNYTVNHLLLAGSSLYLGQFKFTWEH